MCTINSPTPKLIFALLLLLCGCAVHFVDHNVPLPASVPYEFTNQGDKLLKSAWWYSFDSDTLTSLIETTLGNNLDLMSSAAKVRQSQALADKALAPLFPSLSIDSSALRSKNFIGGSASLVNRFDMGGLLNYELDLWQRISSLHHAASLDTLAAEQTHHELVLILAAQTASVWFQLLELHAQLRLLQSQEQVSSTFLSLIELRFSQGLASAVEVFQQREQVASIQSQIPPVRSQIEVLEHALAILQGFPPTKPMDYLPPHFSTTNRMPPDKPSPSLIKEERILETYYKPLPRLGLPTEVLFNRPDIKAAQAKLLAADYRLGASIADRLPRISLSGASGYQGAEAKEVFDNWIWSLAGNIAAPLIDGGSRRAEVRKQQAIVDETLASYIKTVHTALQEIEDALSREKHQNQLVDRLARQLEYAQTALEESHLRYVAGVIPYLTVLTELQAVQRTERLLLNAEKEQILRRVDLYRALGGPWFAASSKTVDDQRKQTVSTKNL